MEGQTYIVGRERRQEQRPSPRERRRDDARSRRYLSIPHASVSRRHCEIVVLNDTVYIRDLGSKNGTFVIRDESREPVAEGYVDRDEVVVFGRCRLQIGDLISTAEERRRTGSNEHTKPYMDWWSEGRQEGNG